MASLSDGAMVSGRVGDDEVVLARSGNEYFAVGARCTHYKGRLARGLIVGDTVRCPLHHACFSLRTGEALRAPAFDAISRWRVEVAGDTVYVREKLADAARATAAPAEAPHRNPFSSSAVAPPGRPLRTWSAAKDSKVRSPSSAPIPIFPSIDRTYRRTISPAKRRTTGCQSGRRSSTPSARSSSCSAVVRRRSIRKRGLLAWMTGRRDRTVPC